MFNLIIKLLSIFLSNRTEPSPKQPKEAPIEPKLPEPNSPLPELPKEPEAVIEPLKLETPKTPIIDWTDPKAKVSKYFSVKEAIWLPQWARLANEADGLTEEIKNNLIKFFQTMDQVREFFNKPITVTVCFRSPEYNKLIGGARASMHLQGRAVDFVVVGMNCDVARTLLLPKLEELDLRMEDLPGSNWIHLDNKQVPNNIRYFKP